MTLRRVIKVGGSCLSNPNLASELARLLAAEGESQNLIIIGGGMCIDAMRDLSSRFELDQTRMHWRCVELLRTSFEVLGELLPQLQRVETTDQFKSLLESQCIPEDYLVAVDTFYRPGSSADSRLPVGWETTTDSIAAYLARLTKAGELCLIKSCPVDATDPGQLSQAGIVDQAFASAYSPENRLRVIRLS
jgi:5-(aminomethyl)-3-furanmethanol phosphate kinase